MQRRLSIGRRFIAIAAAAGLIAPVGLAQAPKVAAAPIVVSSVDFNDSTTGDWVQSGSPTLAYVDDGAGGKALSLTRFNSWDSISSPTGLMAAGTQYTMSMKAMLPTDSTVTSIDIRLTVYSKVNGSDSYDWVGNTTINNTGWTTISGTYTLKDGADPTTAKVYVDTANTDPQSEYTVLVDNILITRPTPMVTIDSVNFDDSTNGDWVQSGSPTFAYVDDGSGGKALSLTRFNPWDSISSPTGIFQAGTEYTMSMKAKLPADSTITSIDIRLTVYSKVNGSDSYDWVGNTTINKDGWSTISGPYTLKDGADPTTAKVYVDTSNTDPQSEYAVLIDDILIQAPQSTTPPPVTTIDSVDFNDSTNGDWVQSGSPTLAYVDDGAGGKALSLTRFNTWDSINSPLGLMQAGTEYTMSMKAKLPADSPLTSTDVRFTVFSSVNGSDTYDWVGNTTINKDGWSTISGTYTLKDGADPATAKIFVDSANTDPQSSYTFIIDDILITAPGASGGGTGVLDSDCSGGYVALTYDDGPYAGQTNLLIAALNKAGLRATFFDWGQHIAGNESLVQSQATLGWVGNHTWDHTDLTTLNADQITAELTQTQNAITGAIGTAPVLMRPPYGSSNDTVKSVEASLGLTEILWDVDSQDWNGATTKQIAAAVRSASSGQVVLMHDNLATTRAAIPLIADGMTATKKCPGMIDPATGRAVAPPPTTVINTNFENGLDGWVARDGGSGVSPTVALTTDESHSATHAVLVSNRDEQGDGISHDVTGVMKTGTKYLVMAYVKFAPGSPTDTLWVKVHRHTSSADTYDTVAQVTGVTDSAWKLVTATYTMGEADTADIYFETTWYSNTDHTSDNTHPFLVDDVSVAVATGGVPDLNLEPIKDSVSFPVGVAISSASANGWPSVLLTHHFDQITPENSMKVEAWYDSNKNFRMSSEAKAILDFAKSNGIRIYGHTLVWHSQTPDWFFNGPDGVTPLTNSDADKALFRTRLQTHINNVAQAISDLYGPFGSAGNPVVAFDVVNEVISDGTTDPEGLRQSRYYQILGEEYIEDAFNWANQAFNVTYAAAGATHPVALAINDYNTDQAGKRQRLHDLVARLIANHVPVDLVGHQFHVSLTTPVQGLDDALAAFEDLPVKQAVTEMDVMTGTPVDDAKLIEQGYYYRDAFRIFRARSADLFSVTVWGLYDSVSWKADNFPLIFDGSLQAKPAYRGVVDSTSLEPRLRTANVFQAQTALDPGITTSLEWKKLPLITFGTGDKVSFQSRWSPDYLSVYASVKDTTADATDALTFELGTSTYSFKRDGTGDVPGVATETAGGWLAVVHLPLSAAKETDKLQFDIADTDGSTVTGWNDGSAMGTLTLCESISYTEIAPTNVAPTIDGEEDSIWGTIPNAPISTDKQVSGTNTATATAKLLYKDNMLYLYVHVVDPALDATNSNPWEKDSVEIYVDNVNAKNSGYRTDDTQMRINYLNQVSFGSGDTEANQAARLTSATKVVDDGYVVEAAISLLTGGGLNSYIGLDVQVNDASGGHRIGMRNWADATNAGYLSPAHWGVARLAPDVTVPQVQAPTPLYLTANQSKGFSGLNGANAGVAVADAYDDAGTLKLTNDAPALLPIGSTVVTWTVTDAAGNSSSATQTVVVSRRVPTLVVPLVPRLIAVRSGSTATFGAMLLTTSSACRSNMPLTFTLNRDPVTGAATPTLIGTATTSRYGIAAFSTSTQQWKAGTYSLTVAFAGNNFGCLASSQTVTLVVAVAHSKFSIVQPGVIGAEQLRAIAVRRIAL